MRSKLDVGGEGGRAAVLSAMSTAVVPRLWSRGAFRVRRAWWSPTESDGPSGRRWRRDYRWSLTISGPLFSVGY